MDKQLLPEIQAHLNHLIERRQHVDAALDAAADKHRESVASGACEVMETAQADMRYCAQLNQAIQAAIDLARAVIN